VLISNGLVHYRNPLILLRKCQKSSDKFVRNSPYLSDRNYIASATARRESRREGLPVAARCPAGAALETGCAFFAIEACSTATICPFI